MDGLDATRAFNNASVWIKGGPGGQVSLRKDCYKWGFFQELADLTRPGHSFRPRPDFDFWQYFKDAMHMQLGKVVEVSQGMWIWQEGPPNNKKDTWHCQYAKDQAQQDLMGQMGCRGGGRYIQKGSCNLRDIQMYAIGDTNVCQLQPGKPPWQWHHLRQAYVVNYPRLLCLLLEEGDISQFAAQTWWARAPTICQAQDHGMVGRGHAWWKSVKGQPRDPTWRAPSRMEKAIGKAIGSTKGKTPLTSTGKK